MLTARSVVDLTMRDQESAADKTRLVQRLREKRRKVLREEGERAAGPPPYKVTLAQARARWPEWEAARNDRRTEVHRAITEQSSPVLADFLVNVHLPSVPPTEIVSYALEIECGHEEFWLVRRDIASPSPPTHVRCPVFWSCQLNDHRTAVRYVEPNEPESWHAEFDLTRWSVALACGHQGAVLRAEARESRVGDHILCRMCEQDDPDAFVEIRALGGRLPDEMAQHWTVELNCGHLGTDHFVLVESRDDPAAYRAQNPRPNGLRCIDEACDQRQVYGVRRLGVLGKIRTPKPTDPPFDPVDWTANDLRRRMTPEQRRTLIRRLQEQDQQHQSD